jgi:hypothetical protein
LGELAEDAGHWDEAMALSEERSMLDPSDTELSLRTAALHAWLGNEANHARFCQQILARVQGTQDPVVADRAARAFCLRPSSDPSALNRVLKLAQHAVELGRGHTHMPYYQLTLGMAQLRVGDLAAADNAMIAVEQSTENNTDVRVPARLIRAMILFRQGKVTEARQLFVHAEAEMTRLPDDAGQRLMNGVGSHDLIAWLFYREAKTLLGAGEKG